MGYGLRVIGYRLSVIGYGLRVIGYGLWVIGYGKILPPGGIFSGKDMGKTWEKLGILQDCIARIKKKQ